MPKGCVYILECCDGTFYTGSTIDLSRRLEEHMYGKGANYTKKRLPVNLVYLENYDRIDHAFNREKQIQRWSHGKKQALIDDDEQLLHLLAECQNETHWKLISASLDEQAPFDEQE
ncbi:GIY-YIG nuclease family protein [Crocinitomix catalasitica]|nr:GIY-YIG nuclease family protein [Crocinitomix catalasitica]